MINHEYLELFNESSVRKDIDIVYDADQHISNSDVVSGTFNLNESAFATKELRFGSLVASELSVKLYNTVPNLMDKEISVSITLDNMASNPLKIGKYKVLEDKPTTDRLYKQIKAYDSLYEVINKEVVSWYEGLLFPMTLKVFRDSFFNYLGIEQENAILINDDMLVDKTILANSIPGKQILSAICELNGAIGRMNRDGKFEYVILDANPSRRITIDNIASKSGSYEDFNCQPISKVQIRQTTDDIGAIVGEDGNTYIMQDNFLVYGKSASDLNTIATNLLSAIKGITYTPFNIKAIYGNPCYEIGDAITVVTKNKMFNSYIFNRTLKGIQAMNDTIKADGVEYYTENLNSANTQIQQLARQTNELSRTVEETKSTITKMGQDLENNYPTTTEMQSAITQSAEEITAEVIKIIDVSDISNTATGNYITVEDSGSYPLIEFYGYGKSEQKSYTGYNQVDLSTPTLEKVSNYSFDNTTGVVSFDYRGSYPSIKVDCNQLIGKTIYVNVKNFTNSNSEVSKCGVDIYYQNAEGKTVWTSTTQSKKAYTIPDDAQSVVLRIIANNSATAYSGTLSANVWVSTIDNGIYEPYVGGEASPNPSYPQDIVSVADDGDLVIKSCGKNLLQNIYLNDRTSDGISITINDDMSINTSGTATNYVYFNINNKMSLPTGTYILSGATEKVGLRVTAQDNSIPVVNDVGNGATFTLNAETQLAVTVRFANGVTVNETIYPMIRLASIDDATYEPYKATQATIPLTDSLRGIKVSEGGNFTDETGQQWVCDTLEKYADGSGKLVQRLGSYIFKGTEAWIQSSAWGNKSCFGVNNFLADVLRVSKYNKIANIMSTHFVTKTPGTLSGANVDGIGQGGENSFYISVYSLGITTLADFKTWLSNNNVTMIYPLAEPIETDLTAEQLAELEKLQTFNPITHVTTDDIGDIAIRYYNNSANAEIVATQGNRISKAESSITQNAESIKSKVSKGDVSSEISQEADLISIKGNRFELLADNIEITKDGKLTTNYIIANEGFAVKQTLVGSAEPINVFSVEGNKSSENSNGYSTIKTSLGYINIANPVRLAIQTEHGDIDTYNTPFITEDYTDNAGWHIRKYSNGVVECEGMFLFTNISPTGTFGDFKTSYMDLTLPSGLFNTAPNKIYNISPLASFGMAVGNIIQNDSASKVRLYCMHTYSSATTYIATVRCWSASSGGVG